MTPEGAPRPNEATIELVARKASDAPKAILRDWRLEALSRSATYAAEHAPFGLVLMTIDAGVPAGSIEGDSRT